MADGEAHNVSQCHMELVDLLFLLKRFAVEQKELTKYSSESIEGNGKWKRIRNNNLHYTYDSAVSQVYEAI